MYLTGYNASGFGVGEILFRDTKRYFLRVTEL